MEEFRNKLLESGVVVHEIYENDSGKTFMFFDPSGNRFFAVEW